MGPLPAVYVFDDYIRAAGSPATLYASDGVSSPVQTAVLASNARYIPMLGTVRGDLIMAQFPALDAGGAPLAVLTGAVVNVPVLAGGWYIVVKPEQRSGLPGISVGIQASLVACPYLLEVRETTPPLAGTLNAYDEPAAVDVGGHPVVATETTPLVRFGFNNDFENLGNTPESQLPSGIRSGHVPLGATIHKGNEVQFPDGTTFVVDQINTLYSDGMAYGLGVVLFSTAGSGLPG